MLNIWRHSPQAGHALSSVFPGSGEKRTGGERVSLPGAALANGLAANALDIDDGHRLVKGHPGASVLPAVLAAAEERNAGLREFLAALAAAYDVAIRAGFVLQRHDAYCHSTGAWGAVGAAAGAANLFGLAGPTLCHALSTADFHAPLAPVMRSVAAPSMDKDGVGWGAMAGMLAREGFTGKPSLLKTPRTARWLQTWGPSTRCCICTSGPTPVAAGRIPPVASVLALRREQGDTPASV